MYEDNEKAVLLQTVKATAFNLLNRDKQMDLQVVFDCGSQCSYVTDRVSRTLAFEPYGRRTMSIAAFGAKETRQEECAIVAIGMMTRHGPDMELSLLCSLYLLTTVKSFRLLSK